MHLACGLFPASTGVVGRGSRHAPRQWPLPPALASWGWPGSQTALGHWALCPRHSVHLVGTGFLACTVQGTCTSNPHWGTGSPALTETGTVLSSLALGQWTLLSQPAPLLHLNPASGCLRFPGPYVPHSVHGSDNGSAWPGGCRGEV